MSRGKDPVSLGEVNVEKATERALLVHPGEDNEHLDDPIWIPLSVIHDDSEVYSAASDEGELVVERWWAEEKGYI